MTDPTDEFELARRRKLWKSILTNAEKSMLRQMPSAVASIVLEVSHKHLVRVGLILSDSKRRHVTACRDEVAYRIKADNPARSYPLIGKWLGRDHTSVMHAVARHAHKQHLPPLGKTDVAATIERKRDQAFRWWRQNRSLEAREQVREAA